MIAPASIDPSPYASEDYWRGIFTRNPDFCSWQSGRQAYVRDAVCARLNETGWPRRLVPLNLVVRFF